MHRSCFASLLAAVAGLLAAAGPAAAAAAALPPSPAGLAPRCGTTYYPAIQQQLVEAAPDAVGANTAAAAGGSGAFAVRQDVGPDGTVSGRVYQLVAFDGLPAGAYGCQLAVAFPGAGALDAWVGAPGRPAAAAAAAAPQLNVTTVLRRDPGAIAYPNGFSFDAFPAALAPGPGLFGTVAAVAGTTAVVNAEACDRRLAFVFSVASWTGQSAGAAFAAAPPAGVYLTANC